MWIRNTSRYPDAEIERLILFASDGIDVRKVCVNVRNGALAGGAYNGVPEISNAPRKADYLITLRLGTGRERWPLGPVNYHFKAPDEVGPRNRFPFFVCNDWREWLVKLAAHEAHHIRQFREKRRCSEIEPRNVPTSLGRRLHWKVTGSPGSSGSLCSPGGWTSTPARSRRASANTLCVS